MTFEHLGSVSSGTFKSDELIPAFIDMLAYFDDERASLRDKEYTDSISSDSRDDNMVDDLINELSEYAPDYCYFGAHPGDGADFGFWVDHDAISDAVSFGELTRLGDASQLAAPSITTEQAIVVNDHGNMTLYSWDGSEWVEQWAIV